MLRIGSCLIVELFIVTACCRGAEPNAPANDQPTAYVGAGVILKTQPYVGTDTRVYPIPLFAYEGKRLYLRGVAGGYWLFTHKGLSVGPMIQPRLGGYEEDDSSLLDGMDDRDWSLDGGVGVSWLTDIGLFGVSFVTDLLGRHDGQELDFNYTIRFERAGFDFIPSLGARWKSDNLVDYYYGVEADEVRLAAPFARSRYEGSDAVDPYARVAVRRKLNDRWSLLGVIQYEWLDDDITDSPIVDDSYEASFLVGALYTW